LDAYRNTYKNPPFFGVIFPDSVNEAWYKSSHSAYLDSLIPDKSIKIVLLKSDNIDCSHGRPAFSTASEIDLCLQNFLIYEQIATYEIWYNYLSTNDPKNNHSDFITFVSDYQEKAVRKYRREVLVKDKPSQICSNLALFYEYSKKIKDLNCNISWTNDYIIWYRDKINSNINDNQKNIATYIKLSTDIDKYLLTYLVLHEYAHILYHHHTNIEFSVEQELEADKYALKRFSEIEDQTTANLILFQFYLSSLYMSRFDDHSPVARRFEHNFKTMQQSLKLVMKMMKDDKDFSSSKDMKEFEEKVQPLLDLAPPDN